MAIFGKKLLLNFSLGKLKTDDASWLER